MFKSIHFSHIFFEIQQTFIGTNINLRQVCKQIHPLLYFSGLFGICKINGTHGRRFYENFRFEV